MRDSLRIFREAASTVLFEREAALELALAGLLAQGHLLIEDMPGVGKTTFALTLARLLGLEFRRVQMTNDLLPADLLGGAVFNSSASRFEFRAGPIFAPILLVDELNRGSPRTQSAFMEAMEERAVSIDGTTHPLPAPFFVIATQNPLDQAGTSPLPEGQLDRFMLSLHLGFPSRDSEIRLLLEEDPRHRVRDLKTAFPPAELTSLQEKSRALFVSKTIGEYVQALLETARGAGVPLSPRAGQHLVRVAKALATLDGRDHVLPDDVKKAAPAVWGHRCGVETRLGGERVREWLAQTRLPV